MIENLEYLGGVTPLAFPVKGPDGLPLTTTDDVAVRILIDEEEDYTGYQSLTEILTSLTESVKLLHAAVFNSQENVEETPEIDTLQEVYNVLTNYTNTQKISNNLEIDEVTEEKVDSLFEQKS